MNALTKVLVFLVLVLSVGFAVSQVILYGKREDYGAKYLEAHRQLNSAVEELKSAAEQLSHARGELSRVRAEKVDVEERLEADLEAVRSQARELNQRLEQEQTNFERLTEMELKLDERIALLKETAEEQSQQIAQLQEIINQKQTSISDLQEVIAQKDSAIGELRHQLNETKKERKELAESNARLQGIVEEFRLRGFEIPPAPAPAINALVVRVDPDIGTVVIDKGAESEVKPNTQFTIYDDEGYVATLVIHDVWDTVAGGLVTRKAEGRTIEVGDKATTEIQVQ